MKKTFVTTKKNIETKWYIIDANGKILGRLASTIANILKGKHKVEYMPNMDIGDYIIVINANKISVTGNKRKNKIYYHHTGYISGIKKIRFEEMIIKNPIKVIQRAIKGMLPKGSLGNAIYKKCKIYSGNQHNHQAQKPKILKIKNREYNV